MVVVVGETARAANWGLSGYARQTTPMLAALMASNAGGSTQGSSDLLLNFNDVTACGTNTETSLPCMFSAIGRRDYDEHRIRTSESLLHVIHRAGVPVRWRDNQSGCKGVCDGLPVDALDKMTTPGLCADGRCFDEILLRDFDAVVAQPRATQVTTPVGASSSTTPAAISADASAVGAANSTAAVPASVGASRLIVLHMLGNHGPTYHKRYPASFGRFTPTCDTGELRQCSPASIVNAYDNALLYTDHVLAQLIQKLKSLQDRYDTAMVYVSDHGESLGERGLYLHGVPYAIAPKEQLKVPMVWWLSAGYLASAAIDGTCLTDQTSASWAHDNLFHTLLGLWRIRASEYDAKLDVQARCASPAMR
jgi:lipid A ethanolaminephosphotransferase